MDEEKNNDFRHKWGKEAKCPFRPNVLCEEWADPEFMAKNCPHCGWYPDEELRRKARLKELVAKGKWVPHFYSLKHYG